MKLLITQMLLEHRLSALLQLHLHSQLNTSLHWIGQRQLHDETRNIIFGDLGASYIRELTVVFVQGMGGTGIYGRQSWICAPISLDLIVDMQMLTEKVEHVFLAVASQKNDHKNRFLFKRYHLKWATRYRNIWRHLCSSPYFTMVTSANNVDNPSHPHNI